MKKIISYILFPFSLIVLNLAKPKHVLMEIKKMLKIYENIEMINNILKYNISNNINLTDNKVKIAKNLLEKNEEILTKYPTFKSYLKFVKNVGVLYNYRNKNYISNQIDYYVKHELNTGDTMKFIITYFQEKLNTNDFIINQGEEL